MVFTTSLLGAQHKKRIVWRTSRQACLLCLWARHLTVCLHFYVADRWPTRPSPNYNCEVAFSSFGRDPHFRMLAVMVLSQHRVSTSKTVSPRIPVGSRCTGHVRMMCSAVCSAAPHSLFDVGARPHLCMND